MTGRIHTPWRQRLSRARVGSVPFVIWVASLGLAVQLWLAGPARSTYHGLAESAPVRIATRVDATVESLWVEPFEAVRAGAVLATLDGARLDAQLAIARSELQRLAAERLAATAELSDAEALAAFEWDARRAAAASVASLEYPAELRAFHDDETRLQLELQQLRLEGVTAELEADRLDVRLARLGPLAAEGLSNEALVEDLERRLAVQRSRATELHDMQGAHAARLDAARARREALVRGYDLAELADRPGWQPDRLAGWTAALVVQERRLDELAVLRAELVVRAPTAGRVSALLAAPGEVLLAGAPLLELSPESSDVVELWLPEGLAATPRLGDLFLVTRLDVTHERSAECRLQALGPQVAEVPPRLWRDPRVAEFGRPCRLGPLSMLGLLPGERVRIDPLGEVRP